MTIKFPKWKQLIKCIGVSTVLIMFFLIVAGCGDSDSSEGEKGLTLQQTLDKLINAAKKDNEAIMNAYIARDSMLDTDSFIETKESTNTDELINRIKLRALTETLLIRIENYTIINDQEIGEDVREIDIEANVKNPNGSIEQTKIGFRFIRQNSIWKLTDWQGISSDV